MFNSIRCFKKNSDYELLDFYEDILMELYVKNNDYKAAFLLLNEQKNRNKAQKISTII